MNPSIQTHLLIPAKSIPGFLAIPYNETGWTPEIISDVKKGGYVEVTYQGRRRSVYKGMLL